MLKKIFIFVFILGSIIIGQKVSAQFLPETYQSIFDEIVTNFEEIRGSTSLNEGKTSLRLLDNEKIILRLDHKRSVKTLTFVIKLDEEGNNYWVSANKLTEDMINKYEDDVTKVLEDMLELSREQAKK